MLELRAVGEERVAFDSDLDDIIQHVNKEFDYLERDPGCSLNRIFHELRNLMRNASIL